MGKESDIDVPDEYVFDQNLQSGNLSELNFESDKSIGETNELQSAQSSKGNDSDLASLKSEEDFSDIDFSNSSGDAPDLNGISLDMDQYLNQFEPKETIDIDEFVSD